MYITINDYFRSIGILFFNIVYICFLIILTGFYAGMYVCLMIRNISMNILLVFQLYSTYVKLENWKYAVERLEKTPYKLFEATR